MSTDSISPTAHTVSTTPSPTVSSRVSCGTNQWCYRIDLYPEIGSETSQTVGIFSTTENVTEYHIIEFTSNGNDCLDPYISASFEEMDYEFPYFDILDHDSNRIERCSSSAEKNCDIWKSCINSTTLGAELISANETYILTIQTGDRFSAKCFMHSKYSFNAAITITCSALTASPTSSPESGCL